ncbi:unnamed protein product, partial [Allacma fusca]
MYPTEYLNSRDEHTDMDLGIDMDILLGDPCSPISFISWEEEMEALLDNTPPDSPSNSQHNHNPDPDEVPTNLTLNLSENEVTMTTHLQQPNQFKSHRAPVMSLNHEKVQRIDRSLNIPKVNRLERKESHQTRSLPKISSENKILPTTTPISALIPLKIDLPQFYPSPGKLIQAHHLEEFLESSLIKSPVKSEWK